MLLRVTTFRHSCVHIDVCACARTIDTFQRASIVLKVQPGCSYDRKPPNCLHIPLFEGAWFVTLPAWCVMFCLLLRYLFTERGTLCWKCSKTSLWFIQPAGQTLPRRDRSHCFSPPKKKTKGLLLIFERLSDKPSPLCWNGWMKRIFSFRR